MLVCAPEMSVHDRLKELLPLLLVGLVLLVFYLTRAPGPLSFLPLGLAQPTAVPATPTAQPAPPRAASAMVAVGLCNPSQPRFVGGSAQLRTTLGTTMGEPIDCERIVDSEGNTQQKTTTGLAYYRKQLKATCFTNGWDHWAVRADGSLVHWAGDAVDPPPEATPITR